MSSDRGPEASARLIALDGVRGLAVAAVFLYHATLYAGVGPGGVLSRAWVELSRFLSSGVELFFVLSGFLITGILLDTKGEGGWIGRFYLRRTLRIFPLYYATLAVVFLVLPRVLSPETLPPSLVSTQRWYWAYLTNLHFARWGWPESSYLGHFWTLAIEEQFYLLWPAVVALASRTTLRRLCVSGIALGASIRVGLVLLGTPSTLDLMTPTQLDGLLAGAWLAARFREPGGAEAVARRAPAAAAVALAGLAALVAWGHGWARDEGALRIAVPTLLALLFGSLVAAAATASPGSVVRRAFSGSRLPMLGKYGYGYYVFHAIIILLMHDHGLDARLIPDVFESPLPGIALFAVVAGAISFVAAVASYHLVEERFLRLKDRVAPARRAPAGAAPASPPAGRTAGEAAAPPAA